MLGNALEVGVELRARVGRPRRVVRQADVDDLRPRADGVEHGVEVVAAVPQLDRARDGAELARVDRVARERRPAADDLIAGVEYRLAEAVDEPVRTGTDGDLLEAQVEPFRERRAQAIGAAVGVAVQLVGATLDRLARPRERPERPFVRRQLDDALEPELALDLLDRLPRLVRDEVVDGGLEEAVRDLRKRPGHGAYATARAASRRAPPPSARLRQARPSARRH